MSGPTLEAVVALHGGGPRVICDLNGWSVQCACGEVLDTLEGFDQALVVQPDRDAHTAHIAAAVLAWIEGRLADGDVREAAAWAINAVEYVPMSGDVEQSRREADAALAAVRGVLGEGSSTEGGRK